jgi:hypothetical protein
MAETQGSVTPAGTNRGRPAKRRHALLLPYTMMECNTLYRNPLFGVVTENDMNPVNPIIISTGKQGRAGAC